MIFFYFHPFFYLLKTPPFLCSFSGATKTEKAKDPKKQEEKGRLLGGKNQWELGRCTLHP
jgi:hypothetical protein